MRSLARLIAVAAVLGGAFWLWTVLFPSPEKIIRRNLATVARDVSFQPNEGPLAIAARTQALAARFSTNVEVNLNVPERIQHTFVGRDEIVQAAVGARSGVSALTVEFLDINLVVAQDKQSATASLVVRADAAGDKDALMQAMKFSFQKIGSDWLIDRVETLRTFN